MKITVTIITLNEAGNISDAIESVEWADEILVVDSESTDATRELALPQHRRRAPPRLDCRHVGGGGVRIEVVDEQRIEPTAEQEHQRDGPRRDAPPVLGRVAGPTLAAVGSLGREELVAQIDEPRGVERRTEPRGIEDRKVVWDLIEQDIEQLLAILARIGHVTRLRTGSCKHHHSNRGRYGYVLLKHVI